MAQASLLFDEESLLPKPEAQVKQESKQESHEQARQKAEKEPEPAPQASAASIEKVEEQRERIARKGRPRSQRSRNAILRATNSLLLHVSVQDLSIEGVAKKAKVGKTTIYRWWPNKTALIMDALASSQSEDNDEQVAAPKSNAEALVLQLQKLIRMLQSKSGETISQLFSAAQADSQAQESFASTFLAPLIDAIQYSVEQGQQAGEFRDDLKARLAVDILCGPVFFRRMGNPLGFDERYHAEYPKEAVKLLAA
jgi:AcrR family transcriptional regulator